MIYTVTLNPSLDYIVSVNDFVPGRVNRTEKEDILPGGKGINVSIVLRNMGMESRALGFIAGFTGEEIKRRVLEYGVEEHFINVQEGMSRINVKLRSNEESEINGMGPDICNADIDKLMSQLDELKRGDVLILAGSIPSVMPETMYRDIMARLSGRDIMVVVDATRDLLVNVLEYHPFLIKPNHYELGEIFGVEITSKAEVMEYAGKLQEKGARNVLVSMAGEGAVLVAEDGTTYESEPPKGKVVNSVGAGDSMVAGFLYGFLKENNYEKAFYRGLCTGSASAFSENLATGEEVDALLKAIKKY
ncbi:MAG: 1-phosphofructokinase [Lachnospiraceae bacterium]